MRAWPFFAVLDESRPSAQDFGATYRHRPQTTTAATGSTPGSTSEAAAVEAHLLWCRLWLGFYEVERHPENKRWNIF